MKRPEINFVQADCTIIVESENQIPEGLFLGWLNKTTLVYLIQGKLLKFIVAPPQEEVHRKWEFGELQTKEEMVDGYVHREKDSEDYQ